LIFKEFHEREAYNISNLGEKYQGGNYYYEEEEEEEDMMMKMNLRNVKSFCI